LQDPAALVACAGQDTDRLNDLLAADRLQVKTGCIRAPLRSLTGTWRDLMSTGMVLWALGLVIAIAGMIWWIHSRSAKSRAKRKLLQISREAGDQPWEDDKDGGRGNR